VSIFVNERPIPWHEAMTAGSVRAAHDPAADLCIVNGGVVEADHAIHDGDRVVLIARGRTPSAEELEALMVARHSPGVHARVKAATVGIAGVGGLGSNVAISLARLGVGRLVVADGDVVEPSNLNRQQYFIDQLGMRKVEALARTLEKINPYVAVECHAVVLTRDLMPHVFRDCAVIVECFDGAEAKAMALSCARTRMRHVPWVMASGLAGYGPSDRLRLHRRFANVFVAGDGTSAAGPGAGLMAPRVALCAAIQANAVLGLLLDAPVLDPDRTEAAPCS
jgi:sulfur carrier protein ThiS adenylyltransferase